MRTSNLQIGFHLSEKREEIVKILTKNLNLEEISPFYFKYKKNHMELGKEEDNLPYQSFLHIFPDEEVSLQHNVELAKEFKFLFDKINIKNEVSADFEDLILGIKELKGGEFNELLEKCNVVPGSATRELIPLMKKEYVPLIEDLFRKGNLHPYVAANLLAILYINKYKLSDEVIEIILDGIIANDKKYIGFIEQVGYLAKDKKYCPKLKKILEVHATKEMLVEKTYGYLYYLINTIARIECTECIPKLKEISSFGLTKMNGRISVSTEEALETLDKKYKSEYLDKYRK